jgi:hypothetical protein
MPRTKRNRRRLVTAAVGVATVGTVAAVALGSPGSGRVVTLLVAKADNNETVELNNDRIKSRPRVRPTFVSKRSPSLQAATAAGTTSRASTS